MCVGLFWGEVVVGVRRFEFEFGYSGCRSVSSSVFGTVILGFRCYVCKIGLIRVVLFIL